MKYDLLKEVLKKLEKYENQGVSTSLEGFTLFLNKELNELAETLLPPESFSDDTLDKMSDQNIGFENHITFLISMMWKYAKHYIKEAFKDLPIKSIDDFSFLASLSGDHTLNKTDLIHKNIAEIPSGMEIIKRLTQKGMITSFADPNDKRAKRLKITPVGQGVMGSAIVQLMRIAKIIVGDLTLSERMTLLSILEKLNHFHADIHENDWKSDLNTLETKYVLNE